MVYFVILCGFVLLAAVALYIRPPQKGLFAKMAAVCCRIGLLRTRCAGAEKRVEKVLIVLFAGNAAALFLWLSDGGIHAVSGEGYIARNEPGGGSREVFLAAERENGGQIKTSLTVQEKPYGEEELEELYRSMREEVEAIALGSNPSWNEVSEALNLPGKVEGYPFTLQWDSSDYALITGSGDVADWEGLGERKKNPCVTLYMKAVCRDFEREEIFYARVCPGRKESSFEEQVEETLREAENAGGDIVVLPAQVEGETLIWSGRRGNGSGIIMAMSMCAAIAVFIAQGRDEEKKRQREQVEMEEAYPSVISKLTLYLGAGMSLKNAWHRTAEEKENDNPVYRMMMQTCREMEGGLGEAEAYEQFGRRVRGQRYIRLTTLLVQNLKKGNAALLVQLRNEALLAMEDKETSVRRRGEEAGTKLLFPMLLMMGMVMVLIMVPAFISF